MIIRKRIILYPSLKNRVAPAMQAVPTSPNLESYSKIVCEADREGFERLLNAQKNGTPLHCASSPVPPKSVGYIIEDTANNKLWSVPTSKIKEFMAEHGEFLTDFSAPIYMVIYEDRIHMCEPDCESLADPTIIPVYDTIVDTFVSKRVQVGETFRIQSSKGIRTITAKGTVQIPDMRLAHPELANILANEVEDVSRYRAYYNL